MSRAVVRQTILADARLVAAGFDEDHVITNYDGEQRPDVTNNMFMIIRWGDQSYQFSGRRGGERDFDVWVHMLRERSTDYTHIDDVIDILDEAFEGIIDTLGDDSRGVTVIESEGCSGDLFDPSYRTLCRRASYRIVNRVSV